jgi:von Willebrand factor A domain-containing protein 8
MQHTRFDALAAAEGCSVQELEARGFRRVSPEFRVIAIGVPVPPFPGRTLDPPLRCLKLLTILL